MKALVTGGTGFVGSHLVRQLIDRGHQVRVLHRESSKLDVLQGLQFESALGDVTDVDALERACSGVDWVFHVAAVADYWRADAKKMFEVNVGGTRNVLHAAQVNDVKRVVFTSSAAAVGLQDNGTPSDETVTFNLKPEQFPYGYSKHLAEQVVAEAVAGGQDVVIVNPVVVIGPGDLNVISGSFIIETKKYGRFTPITSGGISVVDVRDVARWHILAAEQGNTGERYILGTRNYTNEDWFKLIAEIVGVGTPFLNVPDIVLPAVAGSVDFFRKIGINMPLDADQVRLGSRNVFFDASKTHRELGMPEIKIPQSVRDAFVWYQEHGYV